MTLESQYKIFKNNNPDSGFTFEMWTKQLSDTISNGMLKLDIAQYLKDNLLISKYEDISSNTICEILDTENNLVDLVDLIYKFKLNH